MQRQHPLHCTVLLSNSSARPPLTPREHSRRSKVLKVLRDCHAVGRIRMGSPMILYVLRDCPPVPCMLRDCQQFLVTRRRRVKLKLRWIHWSLVVLFMEILRGLLSTVQYALKGNCRFLWLLLLLIQYVLKGWLFWLMVSLWLLIPYFLKGKSLRLCL